MNKYFKYYVSIYIYFLLLMKGDKSFFKLHYYNSNILHMYFFWITTHLNFLQGVDWSANIFVTKESRSLMSDKGATMNNGI